LAIEIFTRMHPLHEYLWTLSVL